MRKLLFASVFALAPFAAFAGDIPAGFAVTAAHSAGGVGSTQGTVAGSMVRGDGLVINGAVAGNYTSVQTTGAAKAGPDGSKTKVTATQLNIGGAVTAGFADTGRGGLATGMAGANQQSAATGGSTADARFVIQQPKPRDTHPRGR
jgi:hypothetical protein